MELVVGVAFYLALVLVVYLANKVAPRWLSYLAAVGGLVLAVVLLGFIAGSQQIAARGFEIAIYLAIAHVIIKWLFFSKKPKPPES
ncbi:MAG: hypothetical protein ACREF9_14810 [Opitutaceae bacterium]